MRRPEILRKAEDALADAYTFLEKDRPGRGDDFLINFYDTTEKLCVFPEMWRVIENDFRRALVPRSAYAFMYTFDDDKVYITAVYDTRMHPEAWKKQL